MIPKILHQIFIVANNKNDITFPSLWKKFTQKNVQLHPSWEYIYWNNDTLHTLVHTQYPHLQQYFTNNVPPVIQSDIGRYLILYHYGGWYCDFDYELWKTLDKWNIQRSCITIRTVYRN